MLKFEHIIVFCSILLTILTSCTDSQQNSKNSPVKLKEIDQFNIAIDEYALNNEELAKPVLDSCFQFYNSRSFNPVWIRDSLLDSTTSIFFNYICNDTLLNTLPQSLTLKQNQNETDQWYKEIHLYYRLSAYLAQRDSGIYNFADNSLRKITISSNEAIGNFVKNKSNELEWLEYLIAYQVKNKEIIKLHKAINEFSSTFSLQHKVCKIDETKLNESVFECLKNLGYSISKDSSHNVKNLLHFQYNNGLKADGVIGKNTISALEKNNYERYLQSIITLDYLRQFSDSILPKKMIKVNIPSFLLSFYNEDTIAFKSRVVVGAKKTKTPTFQAIAKYVVTNPYWHVPYSIASKEILYSAKKDSMLFEKKRYKLLKNDIVIDHDTIDWSKYTRNNFPFRIRQEFGPSNSLGKVKLIFPNRYSVYIHDTPSKRLFKTSVRAYSHGCIRTERPDSLVKLILAFEDHKYLDSLDTLYSKDKETYLHLHDRFPVSIEYQTVLVDDSTTSLRVYPDIYGRLTDFIELSK
jgi:murein L,D-transpeptidase YcbB/YkuD